MRKLATCFFVLASMLAIGIPGALGQRGHFEKGSGADIRIPASSLEDPFDVGVRAHTNHMINMAEPEGGLGPSGGMSPAQLRSFYSLPSTGGSGIIAIVDAFHYPTALHDFNMFAAQFGLPQETSTNVTASTNTVFQIVFASGSQPAGNCGWNQEEALDIEWAHALAPSAKIVLVEAASDSLNDLFAGVDKASSIAGVKEVSMSWGGTEFSTEVSFDTHFPQNNGIVYFAASGDTGGEKIYPAASPDVVACGGTTVNTNASGAFTSETAWSGTGGGKSSFEGRPIYQATISNIVATSRGIPDVASDANPNTGVSVYDSTVCQRQSGWLVFGGTSVATPCIAAMMNLSGTAPAGSTAALTTIYANLGTANFRDITSGTAGRNRAAVGWDFITGVGSPHGTAGL